MILVLDNEVQPDYRYLGPEIDRLLPKSEYVVGAGRTKVPDPTGYDGVVLSGSTASVYDDDQASWLEPQYALIEQCIEAQVPLLGICFGHQQVNAALGGTVEEDERRATFVEMERLGSDTILDGLEPIVPVLHADLVTELGDGMEATAKTAYNKFFCSRHESAPLWTVQFHPEFTARVSDRPSDWNSGRYTFDDSNATEVLDNFANACSENRTGE
ncbi:gamma-glutamyl-gamma-aminobutyrate hydrolase family protein [Halomicroarcula limicola]|uniref:Gamma-glutamyl-gamma-aminobutyrate hydrolase family protein n=1 Tax=Haloarcula limicola TaxID=1429915 RepID=A0A8J8C538_9EURY|nr:gamma-glutamyl-gamma-aminobutyrate hydrolase family protein [Halomicroarcula limicola]MBV0926321.1 gamma-glutamyl-gamma-aminobutyrate hydrolase family protein [Halomicroarcula limicola]